MLNYDHSKRGEEAGRKAAAISPTPGDLLDPAVPPDLHEDSFLRGYYRALSWEIAELSFAASNRAINEFRTANDLPSLAD